MKVTITDRRDRATTFQVISVTHEGDRLHGAIMLEGDIEIEIEDFNKLQCIFPLLFDTLSDIMKATCTFYNMFKK